MQRLSETDSLFCYLGRRLGKEIDVRQVIVVPYRNPGVAVPVADVLTEVLRSGAQELLQEAVEIEVAVFIGRYRDLKDAQERQRIVRNGYQPRRREGSVS